MARHKLHMPKIHVATLCWWAALALLLWICWLVVGPQGGAPAYIEPAQALLGTWQVLDRDETLAFDDQGGFRITQHDRQLAGTYRWIDSMHIEVRLPLPDEPPPAESAEVVYLVNVGPADLELISPEGTLTHLVREAPGSVEAVAYYHQAESHRRAGRLERAIDIYGLAHRSEPNFVAPLVGRAKALASQGNTTAALADLDQAVALFPSVSAFTTRGMVLVTQRQYDAAVSSYNSALRRHANDPEALLARGAAWQFLGRYDEALDDMNRAVDLVSGDPLALLARSALFEKRGELPAAELDYSRAIALASATPEVYLLRARVRRQRGRFVEALADYDQALQQAELQLGALIGRAWILAAAPEDSLRDGRQAVETAQRVLQASRGYVNLEALEALAAAQAECGNFAEAVKQQQRAIAQHAATSPEAAEARQRLQLYESGKPWRWPLGEQDRVAPESPPVRNTED